MLNEKRIKMIIIISLCLMEFFVWAINGPNNPWSLGIIGGADGPTSIFIGKPGKSEDGKPSDSVKPDENTGDQIDPNDQSEPGNQSEPDGQIESGGNDGEPPENDALTLQEIEAQGMLILVNKANPIPKDYKPDDLKEIRYFVEDRSPTTRYLRAEAADAFHLLVEKAAEDGIELKMTTAYRSADFQKILYDSYVKKEGREAADKYSAKPGQSEHQTGLAVDVSSPSVDYQLSNDYGKTEEGKWLAEHVSQFGFILRFPKGKEDITGYQYEPWHIRYVGLTAAKEIYEQNLTLEEYLQENNLQ